MKWNEKNTLEKAATIISDIAFFSWLLLEFLASKISLQYANTVTFIAILTFCVGEAIACWRAKRVLSYIAIGGAILLSVVAVLLA